MKLRMVVAGALVWLGAMASVGCGSDDPGTLTKWSCRCVNVCAGSAADANQLSSGDCARFGQSSSNPDCTTTGDICSCNGAKSCAIQ